MSVTVYQNYINGAFTASQEHLDVFNPANGELLAKVPASTQGDLDAAFAAAREAQKTWARKPAIERAGYLRQIAQLIRANAPALARTITLEQGKINAFVEPQAHQHRFGCLLAPAQSSRLGDSVTLL